MLVAMVFLLFHTGTVDTHAMVDDMFNNQSGDQEENQEESEINNSDEIPEENIGTNSEVDSQNLFVSFVQLFVALAIVIGLIFFIFSSEKKWFS